MSAKAADEEFLDAGKKNGLTIWRIENFKAIKIKKEEYGTFYSGDAYLVLFTKSKSSNSSFEWNIHYWLGTSSSIDEYATAAIKAVELDDSLGGKPVQYREVQNHESKLFLSYFDSTGLRYLNGGTKSGFNSIKDIKLEKKLFMVKGKKDIRIVQVPLVADSLNKSDVFILDDGTRIFQWNPPGSSHGERLRASVFAKKIRDDDHGGKLEVIVLDDDWNSNSDFWGILNGSADQIRQESEVKDDDFEKTFGTEVSLYRVTDANSDDVTITLVSAGPLEQSMLDSNDCFIVDCQSKGIFTWIGKQCTKNEKKAAVMAAKKLIQEKNYPNHLPLASVIDGGETTPFKSLFTEWQN